jgi:peptide/nickel transport system ATP-binding protein
LLADPLRLHGLPWDAAAVLGLLRRVGLDADLLRRLPHEISGGQRQRVNIARALATRPSLLVLDEPVSSLDVGVRAQILALLRSVQQDSAIACLFISHDLAVVHALADRVAVMDMGKIVETGPTGDVIRNPQHAATRALLAAAPRLGAFFKEQTHG